jgi:colicin import membrane protein
MPRKKKPAPTDQLPLAPPASDLRVLSVQVRNVLGLDERALDPQGRAVVLNGKNASGKSSLLAAVQAGLGGGSLAKLARVGAEDDPEVVLVLAGPGGEFRVEKKGDETARVLKRVGDSQAFADVARPQQFLSGLFDPRMSNPVAWLLAKPKDQAVLLLEALPLEMDDGALADLAMVRDQLFAARTGVNRDAKSKAQAAEQLRRELPAKAPADPGSAIVAAEDCAGGLAADLAREEEQTAAAEHAALRAAQAVHDEAAERVRADFKEFAGARRAAHERRAAELRAEVERQIAGEAATLENDIEGNRASGEALMEEQDAELRRAREAIAEARTEADAALQGRREGLTAARERLAGLREQADASARFSALDGQAGGFEAEAERHKAESARLTAAMERLDAFRRALAKDLPIPGLEIEGAEIRLDGVLLSQVNESRRVEVAAKVAQARAELNPLKVLFLDGLERLDTLHRTALLEYLVEHGIQAFGAVVTDGEPAVQYVGAVTAEAVGA